MTAITVTYEDGTVVIRADLQPGAYTVVCHTMGQVAEAMTMVLRRVQGPTLAERKWEGLRVWRPRQPCLQATYGASAPCGQCVICLIDALLLAVDAAGQLADFLGDSPLWRKLRDHFTVAKVQAAAIAASGEGYHAAGEHPSQSNGVPPGA